ncbi:hypothetical protein C2845_PM01G48010 [Panicum miliaceum]|uniref:Uncharacterized protein n=1 Tax=Panicum miliaceum TaxID=4540 RepID=A0A3L6TLM7_PANMI|nr:hypothetical protein C2845_PM01G48010 [Panicum miliaceum]
MSGGHVLPEAERAEVVGDEVQASEAEGLERRDGWWSPQPDARWSGEFRRAKVEWSARAFGPGELADYYNISGVFRLGGIPDAPPPAAEGEEAVWSETAVMDSDHRSFAEVVL